MRLLIHTIVFFQFIAALAPAIDCFLDKHDKVEILNEDSKENKEFEDEKEKDQEIVNDLLGNNLFSKSLLKNFYGTQLSLNSAHLDIHCPPPEK